MQRILIIDDEQDIADGLAHYLCSQGLDVKTAYAAKQGRAILEAEMFDLAIIDLGLPDENGLDLARWATSRFPALGLIILTGMTDPVDRTVGLELGADDYVTKPFYARELLARIRTILRRLPARAERCAGPKDCAPAEIGFAEYVISLGSRTVRNSRTGQVLDLTSAEFDLIHTLATSAGTPMSRQELSKRVHGRDWTVADRTIDQLVVQVRRKLEQDSGRNRLIVTVRNIGYLLAADTGEQQ